MGKNFPTDFGWGKIFPEGKKNSPKESLAAFPPAVGYFNGGILKNRLRRAISKQAFQKKQNDCGGLFKRRHLKKKSACSRLFKRRHLKEISACGGIFKRRH